MAEKFVYFQWAPSSFFGWGVYGLNLMLHTASRPDFNAVSSCGVDETDIALTSLERTIVQPSIDESNRLAASLKRLGPGTLRSESTVLHALGNDFNACASAGGVMLEGIDDVGIIFSEEANFSKAGLARAARYSTVVAGSSWTHDALVANGVRNVRMIIQGVDVTNFHLAPRSGFLRDRFVVFSGGKLEYRKGQDLVLQAFRVFAQSHPDALLITAWSSPWPEYAITLNRNTQIVPIELVGRQVDTAAWTTANGIPPSQVVHLGPVANSEMPRILREANVGLFPNRAESGTNLVAMEAMACGVPCMLSLNTGHRDLVGDGSRCLALGRQHSVEGRDGWGSSDVDEIVAVLEAVYRQREAAAEIGRKGAAFMRELSWPRQIAELVEVIKQGRTSLQAAA